MTSLDDDEGEKDVANMASPCPGIDEEHLDTARTRNIACGVYWRLIESSVVLRPGLRRE